MLATFVEACADTAEFMRAPFGRCIAGRSWLYFYAHEGRDQVTCHDVAEYGGTWLVLGSDGKRRP